MDSEIMSVNTNRMKLNKATCSKDYRVIWLKEEFPPYWDEGLNFKKGHSSIKYRSYKTWKYNRRTQWK
jgi:hypothetical protein